MLKLLTGFMVGAGLCTLVKMPWVVAGGLVLVGLMCQMAFATRLNRFLGGADAVAMGARSLDGLKLMVPIPVSMSVLDFAARSSFWGVVTALFNVMGWWRLE